MALALAVDEGNRVVIEFEGAMVVIKVHEVRGNKAKLSFVAVREVSIKREVVFDKINGKGACDVVEQHIERLQEKPRGTGVMKRCEQAKGGPSE